MTNPVAISSTRNMASGNRLEEVVAADQRVGALADEENPQLNALYARLKSLWEANPFLNRAEIVEQMRTFVAEDGTMPFQAIRVHTATLAQVMTRLKDEGGEELAVFKELEGAILFSVASNGILNSFIAAMMEPPEREEEW